MFTYGIKIFMDHKKEYGFVYALSYLLFVITDRLEFIIHNHLVDKAHSLGIDVENHKHIDYIYSVLDDLKVKAELKSNDYDKHLEPNEQEYLDYLECISIDYGKHLDD